MVGKDSVVDDYQAWSGGRKMVLQGSWSDGRDCMNEMRPDARCMMEGIS